MSHFSLGALSGLITGAAADSVLFAFRVALGGRHAVFTRIRLEAVVVDGFTAAQEVGLSLHWVTNFGASFTGGTDLSDPAAPAYVCPDVAIGGGAGPVLSQAVSISGAIRIATTDALAHAGVTRNAQPFAWTASPELAAAAGVSKGFLQLDYQPQRPHATGTDAGFGVPHRARSRRKDPDVRRS
jgi:hypothetical protein